MIINPEIAIKENWITFPTWMNEEQRNKCVQPNAIDFTLDRLYMHPPVSFATITETTREFPQLTEYDPTDAHSKLGPTWLLLPDRMYDGASDFHVALPSGVAARLVVRSSFNRAGTTLTSGLYDSGFNGDIGFMLFNKVSRVVVGVHTRVGQIIFEEAGTTKLYAGHYNTASGQEWFNKQ